MNLTEALAIINPSDPSPEALKHAYRLACFKYHPDRVGDLMQMQLVNAAMEYLSKIDFAWSMNQKDKADKTTPLTETIKTVWGMVSHFPGLNGELIGTWLWVSGDTRPYKDHLKAAGFKWAPKKKTWYFHEGGFRKRSKTAFTMDNVREMWGSENLESDKYQAVA